MRPYPILLLGIANALLWRWVLLSEHWQPVALMGICAVAAGWFTQENPWFATLTLCTAPLAMTSVSRGSPWGWLHPEWWLYFLVSGYQAWIVYLVLVHIGCLAVHLHGMHKHSTTPAPPPARW